MLGFLGYYTVSVPKDKMCQVVAVCLNYGISTFHEREIGEEYTLRVGVAQVSSLLALLQRAKVPYRVGELRGLLGFGKRLISHPGLLAGALLSLFLYLWLGGMVWEVRVVSSGDVDEDRVLSLLAEAGLEEGVRLSSIDIDRVVNAYLLSDPDTAFAAVHLRGVVAEIELIPKDAGGEDTGKAEPCNIVATRDALITDMILYAGVGTVRIGDTVAEGDILVSGIITDKGGTRFLPASADVWGQVEDVVRIEVPLVSTTRQVVAKKTVGAKLQFFGMEFSFGNTSASLTSTGRQIYLFDRIRLPIRTTLYCHLETREVEVTYDEKTARQMADAMLRHRLSEMLRDSILIETHESYTLEGQVLVLECRVRYETNISKTLAFESENR